MFYVVWYRPERLRSDAHAIATVDLWCACRQEWIARVIFAHISNILAVAKKLLEISHTQSKDSENHEELSGNMTHTHKV